MTVISRIVPEPVDLDQADEDFRMALEAKVDWSDTKVSQWMATPEFKAFRVKQELAWPAFRKIQKDRLRMLGDDEVCAVAPEFSEMALVDKFVERHKHELRYVTKWEAWLAWDGQVWTLEGGRSIAKSKAKAICVAASQQANDPTERKRLASARVLEAVERTARDEAAFIADVALFDADPFLLNTPGGVYDLRSGEKRDARPEDYMTKITAVAPKRGEHEKWSKALKDITCGTQDLENYLQRVFGYCLTGSTKEHALFFCYGTGRNGKGTLLNTVARIMGAYAATAPAEAFKASKQERHPTSIAALNGARMVLVGEFDDGRLNEALLKGLTGGDPITARFMKQNEFTFRPQCKPILSGNHPPGIRDIGPSMRERFKMLRFMATFREDEGESSSKVDKNLVEALIQEWPAILQWMIDGCKAWVEGGLQEPSIVKTASRDFMDEQDPIGRWIDERCTIVSFNRGDKAAPWTSAAALWADFKRCEEESRKHYKLDKTMFANKLRARGDVERAEVRDKTPDGKDRKTVVFRGITLLAWEQEM